MALTEIEYASLASSEILNNNFNYLDNRIASVSEDLNSNTASIYANIASVNSAVTSLQENLSSSFESAITNNIGTVNNTISSNMSTNGLYITTYVNGTSWYREYFSDSERTNRIWLVQGGVTTSWSVTLLKSHSDTNFTVIVTSRGSRGGNTDYQIHANVTSVNAFGLSGQWSNGAYWVTFGK